MPDALLGIVAVPDLVVDVVSPSSGGIDGVQIMALYASAGVAEYWIADPMRRSLDCFAQVGGDYRAIVPDTHGRIVSGVLPGLVVDPASMFAVLD